MRTASTVTLASCHATCDPARYDLYRVMRMVCGTLLGLFLVYGPVSALGNQPVIRMDGFLGRNIQLLCKTHSSSSDLQISWKDGDGNSRASSNSKTTENPKGVFTVLRHIDIAKDPTNKYTCLVHSEGLKPEAEAVIQISGELFPKELSLSGWQIAFIIVLLVILSTIVAIAILFQRKRKLFQELKTQIQTSEWKRITNSAASVTMDSNTAHSELTVSEDKLSVTHRETPPDTKERFDHYPRILGSDPFASAKHYWEVDVGVKTAWDVGIAQKSVVENTTTVSPDGYWAVLRKDEKAYKAVGSNVTARNLILRQIPKKIGVYLDCEGQTLSFFNPESRSLLHTIRGNHGDLYPLFSPGLTQGGKNSEPLKICPLQNISGDKVAL